MKKNKVLAVNTKTGSKYIFCEKVGGMYKVATAKSMKTYTYYLVVSKHIKLMK